MTMIPIRGILLSFDLNKNIRTSRATVRVRVSTLKLVKSWLMISKGLSSAFSDDSAKKAYTFSIANGKN